MSSFKSNYEIVLQRIEKAAERSSRLATEIKLVAVSKTHTATTIQGAIDAGCSVFGENKVQEAEPKIKEIGRGPAEWHLIGHLQSNKARKAVQLFEVIHSLDSIELADRLERICIEENRTSLPVLIQADLGGEKTKSGIGESNLSALVDRFDQYERLSLIGLMALPPFFEDPQATRPYFIRLREIRDRLNERKAFASGHGELSMGMSHDFEVAIEEGATIVRVGTAIFGERQYNQ